MDMKELKKLMSEKKGEDGMDMSAKAKMEMLKELKEEAMGMMGEDVGSEMGSMQEVTVAAPDKESLMEGLDKAEDVVEKTDLEKELMGDEDAPEGTAEEMKKADGDMDDAEDGMDMDLIEEELALLAEDEDEEDEEKEY